MRAGSATLFVFTFIGLGGGLPGYAGDLPPASLVDLHVARPRVIVPTDISGSSPGLSRAGRDPRRWGCRAAGGATLAGTSPYRGRRSTR